MLPLQVVSVASPTAQDFTAVRTIFYYRILVVGFVSIQISGRVRNMIAIIAIEKYFRLMKFLLVEFQGVWEGKGLQTLITFVDHPLVFMPDSLMSLEVTKAVGEEIAFVTGKLHTTTGLEVTEDSLRMHLSPTLDDQNEINDS